MDITLDAMKALIKAAGLQARRANGGWLLHAVQDNGFALCGHKPKNTGRIFHRGCWTLFGATRPCRKCHAALVS